MNKKHRSGSRRGRGAMIEADRLLAAASARFAWRRSLCRIWRLLKAASTPTGSVTCILRWASYNEKPSCTDQINSSCSIHDCMFEESVCLLLGTSWFEASDEVEEDTLQYEYDDELDDLDESYYVTSKSSIHIGNRRWGDNGYVKAGRKAARPVLYRYDDRCRSKEERSTKGCHWQKGEKGPEARGCREGCRRQAPAAFAEAGPLTAEIDDQDSKKKLDARTELKSSTVKAGNCNERTSEQ
ncbi:hypothetical protein C4D60_Mb03t08410 [Musa balbisiana]|uniref:Uncharacterized protein n=1 Tax=Musa balbisiana TaxID=52838 RepID=A0A4V6T4C0_MUSBA|nr:hypothetical protein C4D60_Mb03t08410 [Musa balbisiana]